MKKFLLILILVIYSCKTTPYWIDNYPYDSEYYTAIGFSNTGLKSQDIELSYENALKIISSEISVEITHQSKSNRSIEVKDDKRFINHETNDMTILSTSSKISNIEIYDTHYSKDKGYWTYIRLKKTIWKEYEQSEAIKLGKLIEGKINDLETLESLSLDDFNQLLLYIENNPFGYTLSNDLYEEILKLKNSYIRNNINLRFIVESNSSSFNLNKIELLNIHQELLNNELSGKSIKIYLNFNNFPPLINELRASQLTVTYVINENRKDQKALTLGTYKGTGLDKNQAQLNAYKKFKESINSAKIIESYRN